MKQTYKMNLTAVALVTLLSACATPELTTETIDMPMTITPQKFDLSDADADGVITGREKCLTSMPNSRVDNNGCGNDVVDKVRQELKIQFANNSDVVEQRYYYDIQKLADFMQRYPSLNVVIEGHTSKQGSGIYNMALSERRAKAVADILVSKFDIPSFRVSAVGYGLTRLLDSADTQDAHSKNRRIVAELSNEVVNADMKWTIYSVDGQ